MKKIVFTFLLFCLLASPISSWAHPFDIFGTGPRAIAMGGAYAAIGDDMAGLYYNVAGIARVKRMEVEFGYLYGKPTLMINGKDLGVDRNSGTNFGLLVSHIMYGHRFTAGANIYIPDDHVLRFQMLPSRNPRFTMYTNRNHSLIALVGGGLEIFPWWTIGAGASFLGDNFGGVDFVVSEASPSAGSLESSIGSVFSPLAGMWFDATSWLDVGISYREKIQVELDLPNNVYLPEIYAFNDNGIPILTQSQLVLLAYSFSHFSPRQFQIGTAWKFNPRVLMGLDVTYYMWSEFENPTPIAKIELSGGLGDLFEIGPADPRPNPEFKDVIVPAVGVEWRAVDLDLFKLDARGGYFYRRSPAPNQVEFSNFVDSNAHVVSTGLGVTWEDPAKILLRPLSFNLYFQAHLLEPKTVEKVSPADPTGDYTISGYVLIGGGNLTIRF